MASGDRHPYSVRQQTSGYNGVTRYIVVMNPGGRRVSVEPHCTREGAQFNADELNIGSMVRDYDCDPRPYHVRLAEAKSEYEAGE